MKLPDLKWFLPSRYELRHPLRWLSRCWHWRVTYPLDTYTAGVLEDLQATADKAFDSLMDKVEESYLDDHADFYKNVRRDLTPGFIDMEHYRIAGCIDDSPWLLSNYQRYTHTTQWSTWQRTCVYSGCCDVPVYRRTSFAHMRAFHWCPKCETLLTTVDTEAAFDMMNGVGESFVDNDFYM